MPKKQRHYPDPKPMTEETAAKFRKFMDPKKAKKPKPPWLQPKGGWQLWNWKTLEDCKQE